jgi:hypothetical protein
MKKSWKTSAGGIATILAGLSASIILYQQGNVSEAIATAIAAISTGLGLLSARDEKATSQDAGAVNKPTPDKTQ